MSWISDVYKCRLGMVLTVQTCDRLTTVVIEVCTACGQPAVDDLWANKEKVALCASTSVVSTPGNRRCTLAIALHDQPPSA